MCTLWRLPHDCRLPLQVSERRYTGRRGEGEEQCVRPCVLKFTTLAMVGVTGLPGPWFSRPIGLFSRKIEGENCHRDLVY